jgi:hypothetical protein
VYVIHEKLSYLASINMGKRKSDFWWPINKAWDALAYNHYEQTSWSKHMAGLQLSGHYRRTREPVIKLSDPQVRILDALTEAVGIPHKRGQTDIEIPQEASGYEEWLAKAESERNNKK